MRFSGFALFSFSFSCFIVIFFNVNDSNETTCNAEIRAGAKSSPIALIPLAVREGQWGAVPERLHWVPQPPDSIYRRNDVAFQVALDRLD